MADWSEDFINGFLLSQFFLIPTTSDQAIAWLDKDGNWTYEESKAVAKETIEIPRAKLAETGAEFGEVYDREFSKHFKEDTPENHKVFSRELKKHLQTLITSHSAGRKYETLDFKLLATAERFLDYLDPDKLIMRAPTTELAEEVQSRVVSKLPYDIDNYRYFSIDNAIRIIYSVDAHESLDDYDRYVFQRENHQLIIAFGKEFKKAGEAEVVELLEKHYTRTEVTGVPKKVWLDNVETIIRHHKMMELRQYAKNDAVLLWFRNKRKALAQEPEREVPFIGDLFRENLNIAEIIYDFYYAQVRQPLSRDEISEHYVGRLHWHNQPYQVNYFGAYLNMGTVELFDMYRRDKMHPFDKVSEADVKRGLQDLVEGFKHGYFHFEQENLDRNPFQDSAHKAQVIFDFITGPMFGVGGSLPITEGGRDYFEAWHEYGISQGKRYRAWYLIFENYSLFVPLFEARRAERQKRQTTNAKPEFSLKQIALLYIYKGEQINHTNADQIARQYHLNSGKKLMQFYGQFLKTSERQGLENTDLKTKNKIALMEDLLPHLTEEQQATLNKDIAVLKENNRL